MDWLKTFHEIIMRQKTDNWVRDIEAWEVKRVVRSVLKQMY